MSDILADRFRKWHEYEKDAHAKVVRSLESVPAAKRDSAEYKKAVSWLAHLASARRIWLERLGAIAPQASTMFPEHVELAQVAADLNGVHALWSGYMATLCDADLARSFEYQSFDGGRFRNQVEDILTQLFGHSSYHRGQIASLVRATGGEPAKTDYIYCCRESLD